MNYKISIIMPCYNHENFLNRSIESVINQTIGFENIELIIIDNGSTDSSPQIIQKYSDKYENIKAIFIESNTGSGAVPRNMGLENVNTDYIMFLDSDDAYMPDYCEVMYKKISESNMDLVKCNSISISDDGESYGYYFDKKIKEKTIKNTELPLRYVAIWNGIHKTEIIRKNNIFFPDCNGEDTYFTTLEFLNINGLLYLNDYFGYIYNDRAESHARKPEKENILSLIKSFEITRDICEEYNREDVMNTILGQQIIAFYSMINNSSDSLTDKKELMKKFYKLRKTMPHLYIKSISYKIADKLIMKKLFNLTLLYLKIVPRIYNSKIILKMLNR